jgi:hypothetical protein
VLRFSRVAHAQALTPLLPLPTVTRVWYRRLTEVDLKINAIVEALLRGRPGEEARNLRVGVTTATLGATAYAYVGTGSSGRTLNSS